MISHLFPCREVQSVSNVRPVSPAQAQRQPSVQREHTVSTETQIVTIAPPAPRAQSRRMFQYLVMSVSILMGWQTRRCVAIVLLENTAQILRKEPFMKLTKSFK